MWILKYWVSKVTIRCQKRGFTTELKREWRQCAQWCWFKQIYRCFIEVFQHVSSFFLKLGHKLALSLDRIWALNMANGGTKPAMHLWGKSCYSSELPPSMAKFDYILHKWNRQLMRPHRADVPDPACGVGLNCRKIPVPRRRYRARPPGGSHIGVERGLTRPLESRESAVTPWTPPMLSWP